MSASDVSASTVIAAPATTIFMILADPRQHARIDGSGTVRGVVAGPDRLELGSEFGMSMKMGAPYKIKNRVVEFEEGRLIAWRHFNGHRWRWRLEPVGDGTTRVTEEFDWSTARVPLLISVSWFPRGNRRSITRTLDRLAARFAPR